MPQIKWPAKYVKKGAKVVNTPIDVLRILADNNIFRLENGEALVQQTLMDYFNKPASNSNKEVEWIDPVIAEE